MPPNHAPHHPNHLLDKSSPIPPIVLVDHDLAPSIVLERAVLQQSLYATLEAMLGMNLHEAYHTVRADLYDYSVHLHRGIRP